MVNNRKVTIIEDADNRKLVLINDIVFKGKRNVNWADVKQYLKGFIGDFYDIKKSSERIYIGNQLPDEFTGSESRKVLVGANAKA